MAKKKIKKSEITEHIEDFKRKMENGKLMAETPLMQSFLKNQLANIKGNPLKSVLENEEVTNIVMGELIDAFFGKGSIVKKRDNDVI